MASLVIIITLILLSLVCFIISIMLAYQRNQIIYLKNLEEVKSAFEKAMLTSKLEIQEETFQHISREIHDNISLSLTLAKLNLNTINYKNEKQSGEKVNASIELLSQSISDLSHISKGLNSEIINQQGLLKALEYEISKMKEIGLYSVGWELTGNPIYMNPSRELIIFRIVQESFNNILKHSQATYIYFLIHYNSTFLFLKIKDNGKGFNIEQPTSNRNAGLKNMTMRIEMLGGTMDINSIPKEGTTLSFTIPFE